MQPGFLFAEHPEEENRKECQRRKNFLKPERQAIIRKTTAYHPAGPMGPDRISSGGRKKMPLMIEIFSRIRFRAVFGITFADSNKDGRYYIKEFQMEGKKKQGGTFGLLRQTMYVLLAKEKGTLTQHSLGNLGVH